MDLGVETRRRVGARGTAGVLTRRDATAVVINVVVSCGPVLILWIRFGAIASCFLGLLTYETTQNANASVVATGIMAIIPAHIMRSVGGGYDNESFAITAMLATCVFGADRPPPFARDAAATSPREPRTMLEAARRSSRESAALTPRPRARRCRSRALIRFCGRRWVLGLEPACGSSFLVIVVVGRGGGVCGLDCALGYRRLPRCRCA